MRSSQEIEELRSEYAQWMKVFEIVKFVPTDEMDTLTGKDERFVWTALWDFDGQESMITPGLIAGDEPLGYYLAGKPWSDEDQESGDFYLDAVTPLCDDCDGDGGDCETCDGQGFLDELVEFRG